MNVLIPWEYAKNSKHKWNSIFSLFLESTRIFSLIIMIQLIFGTLYIACVIFQLSLVLMTKFHNYPFFFLQILSRLTILYWQQVEHFDASITVVLLRFTINLTILLVFCYYGKMATESFENMADCLYESNWLDLTVDLQKYFITLIINTQRRLYYHGYGMVVLDLETFCRASEKKWFNF